MVKHSLTRTSRSLSITLRRNYCNDAIAGLNDESSSFPGSISHRFLEHPVSYILMFLILIPFGYWKDLVQLPVLMVLTPAHRVLHRFG
jgi:hypothetical protein